MNTPFEHCPLLGQISLLDDGTISRQALVMKIYCMELKFPDYLKPKSI
jgi:hypothetical protein